MSKDILAAFSDPKWISFLEKHQKETMIVTIWAAFGFKNRAENEAVALLHEYNESNKTVELMKF